MDSDNSQPNPPTEAVDLSALVMGFSTAALHYLGQVPVEGKPTPAVNLKLAKQNIDIVKLLKDKTNGNRTPEEDTLFKEVIADLMMRYVDVCKQQRT